MIDGTVINFSIPNIIRESKSEKIIVFPLSPVAIASNNTIAVKLKNYKVNKPYALPRYVRLVKFSISPCPNKRVTIIAVTNGISIVTRKDPSEKIRYFAIKIFVLLLPLII